MFCQTLSVALFATFLLAGSGNALIVYPQRVNTTNSSTNQGSSVNVIVVNPSDLPQRCVVDYHCSRFVSNSHCNSVTSRCQCNFPFVAEKDLLNQTTCVPQRCIDDFQCSSVFGVGAKCQISSQDCICRPGYENSMEKKTCVPMQTPTDAPVLPVEPVTNRAVTPIHLTVKLNQQCGFGSLRCGENATCLNNKCLCPTGFYPVNPFNCSKIPCDVTSDCQIFEQDSYCVRDLFNPSNNKCQCLYGTVGFGFRCKTFQDQWSYTTTYYSHSSFTSFFAILVAFIVLSTLTTIIYRRSRAHHPRVPARKSVRNLPTTIAPPLPQKV